MYQASSEQHRKIVAAIARAGVRPPKTMRNLDWPRFVQAYYANVDAEDLAAREPAELAGTALSHLMFARRRRRSALVRVFNPTLREHGFTSPHTVIEMVNDDMPFLVDSISLALTQRSLTLHFLTHPVFAVTRDGSGNLLSLRRARRQRPRARSSPPRRSSGWNRSSTSKSIESSIPPRCSRSRRRSSAACAMYGWPAPTGSRCRTPRIARRRI